MNRLMNARRGFALAAIVVLTTASAIASHGAANAAPTKNGTPITIICDDGVTYAGVTVPGQGNFTPALAGNGAVLIPMAFGESTFSLYDGDTLVMSDTQPASSKQPATSNKNATVHCTFEGSGPVTFDGKTYTGVFTGTVTGIIAGRVR